MQTVFEIVFKYFHRNVTVIVFKYIFTDLCNSLHVIRKKLPKGTLYEKGALKMFMKLTPSFMASASGSAPRGSKREPIHYKKNYNGTMSADIFKRKMALAIQLK